MNQSQLQLIPKVQSPKYMHQFHPLDVSFKIMTKILVNRLKSLMPQIIDVYQNDFVLRRHFSDNIIIAQ